MSVGIVKHQLDLSNLAPLASELFAHFTLCYAVGEFAKKIFPALNGPHWSIAQVAITWGVSHFVLDRTRFFTIAMISYVFVSVLSQLSFFDKKSSRLPDFLENLNAAAARDPLSYAGHVKREKQLEDALSLVGTPNCMMIANTGAGKTSLVKGIAKKIVEDKISPSSVFYRKTIYSLSMIKLMSGAEFVGGLEKKIRRLVAFLKSNENVILFIDEIHVAFQSGNHSGNSAANVAELLKPHIEENVTIIGGTTPRDLKKIGNLDTAFCRRFEMVHLSALTNSECVTTLKGFMESEKFKRTYPNFYLDEKLLSAIVVMTNLTIKTDGEVQPSVAIKCLERIALEAGSSPIRLPWIVNFCVKNFRQDIDFLSKVLSFLQGNKTEAEQPKMPNEQLGTLISMLIERLEKSEL